MNAMTPVKAESPAHRAITRWYRLQKCHRIDQLFVDHPEFAVAAATIYANDTRADFPSKCEIACEMIDTKVPGFADAVLRMDRATLQTDRLKQGQRGAQAAPKPFSVSSR